MEQHDTFPPRHICVVGALAISAGVGSIAKMAAGLFVGPFTLDIGFVGIPIGYGLWIGRPSSRYWAIFFAAAGTLLLLAFGGWALKDHETGQEIIPYPDAVFTAVEICKALACFIYALVILCGKRYRNWFESTMENPASMKPFAWAVAVVSGILLFSYHTTEWWIKETHDRVFPLHVKVYPYDAETGEGLRIVSHGNNPLSANGNAKTDFPKVNLSIYSNRDGIGLGYSGVATRPVEVSLKSEGYQDTSVTLDEDSGPEIRVPMVPVERTNGEGAGSKRGL